jgi:hypothetical protein
MYMIFTLIQNKFDINKNNDKLFKTIWEYKKKKKKMNVTRISQQCKAQTCWHLEDDIHSWKFG